ncbi:hypothetical protein [Kamptonema formosum]|uniref:hypothetical protein n=1 Tax=Kamptonema formosum TaxID=331992 RepID=UPI000344DC9D|nr:hypothetical protein [Oscillatoria sp. PCC 10802]
MSTQRWTDEMLDRLAGTVENMASTVESHSRLIESQSRLIEGNARIIQALANAAAEAREERQQLLQLIAQHQERMNQQQAEIVGLRTETNRMLHILLNQRNQGDNPNP